MYKKGVKLIELTKDVSLTKDVEATICSYTNIGKIYEVYLMFSSKYTKIKLTIDNNVMINNVYLKDLEDEKVYGLAESQEGNSSNTFIKYCDNGAIRVNFNAEGLIFRQNFSIKATCTKSGKKFQAGYLVQTGGI